MPESTIQKRKDVAKKIERLLMNEWGLKERPSFVMIAQMPDSVLVEYTSNTERKDGLLLLENTINQIKRRQN